MKKNKKQSKPSGQVVLSGDEARLVKEIVYAERDNLRSDRFIGNKSPYEKRLDSLVAKFV